MSDSEDTYVPRDGRDGKNGKDGRDGKDGRNGQQGKPGVNGFDGTDGVDGADGPTGPTGPAGPANGPTGPAGSNGLCGKQGEKGEKGEQSLSAFIKSEIAYTFATSQSVSDGDYIGVGSSDSRLIKNTIIIPKKCTATSLAFSIRQAASAEQYNAVLNVNGVDTSFSAVLNGSLAPYAVVSFGNIELNPLDLISIHFKTNGDSLSRGACITLLTEA